MKWISFVIVACTGMYLFFPSVAFTQSGDPVVIQSISHIRNSENKETITFTLAAPVSPQIFTIGGENPRLVIDFPESIYWGENVISLTDGVLASAIRLGLHQTPDARTRAVVDLSKEKTVQFNSEYSEQENTLTVTLTPEANAPQVKVSPVLKSPGKSALPGQEELSVIPLDSNTTPPVSSDQKVTAGPAGEKLATPVVPTILDISFDASSSRGEMVLFRLNDFSPPKVSAIEKNTPRVLCDFMAMNVAPGVQKTMLANGKYIERIRTAKHNDPDKVRIVLDLTPNRDYDLQQVFFRNDNLFVLIVNELTANQSAQ